MKERIEPETRWTNIYLVQNYGVIRGVFYNLKDARKFVEEEGTFEDGRTYYQIYKGTLKFDCVLYK